MRNAGLDEAGARIKVAGRIINNLRYAGDTTLKAESEEELKSLLMKLKEEGEKVGLNSTFRKLRSWHLVHHFMENRPGNSGISERLYLGGSKITTDGDCSHKIEKHLFLGRKAMTNLDSILKNRERPHFADKGPYGQSYDFPVVMQRCES